MKESTSDLNSPDGDDAFSEGVAGDASATLLRTYHDAVWTPFPRVTRPVLPDEVSWNAKYKVLRPLGRGAQGTVYLAERNGVDGYQSKIALKVFYRPEGWTDDDYQREMRRIASQAQRVSQIQEDNLVTVRDFVALEGTRIMVLEWVDGLDLEDLLRNDRLTHLSGRIPRPIREHLHDVIVTTGEDHCRLKSGIAVDILRGCLAGLSSLHHQRIAHCDLKPSNIMIKRNGTKKIIDIDSSCVVRRDEPHLRGTPYYMAPEQLRGQPVRLRSDVASLGYILIELLTGRLLFRDSRSVNDLLAAKIDLPRRLESVLPAEVRRDPLLFELVSKMVAPDPADRFPHADAAELDRVGAASFHRHLVKQDLSTEYDRELAWWLELLKEKSFSTTC